MKKVFGRNVAIALGIICVLLSASLVVVMVYYTSEMSARDNTISSLNSQIVQKDSQIQLLTSQKEQIQTWLNDNITFYNAQIDTLNAQIATFQSQTDDLTAMVNMSKTELKTLVFHVCEKGEGYTWGRTPNVTCVWNQILALNNGTYDVLLFPEYKGNENWTEALAWISSSFTETPIMLSVFEGGNYTYPVVKLTTDQILDAMQLCDVVWVRISEVVSWYIENDVSFPVDYVRGILSFCRGHNLKVQWTEWKTGDDVFQRIQNYTAGFEDIVTVTFSTNSGELEPSDGFLLMNKLFQNWGGSVQAWWWETRHRGNYTTVPEDPPGISNPLNMPSSWLVQHALSAKYIGAELLQFEPYRYFFDNGEAKESLELLFAMLT